MGGTLGRCGGVGGEVGVDKGEEVGGEIRAEVMWFPHDVLDGVELLKRPDDVLHGVGEGQEVGDVARRGFVLRGDVSTETHHFRILEFFLGVGMIPEVDDVCGPGQAIGRCVVSGICNSFDQDQCASHVGSILGGNFIVAKRVVAVAKVGYFVNFEDVCGENRVLSGVGFKWSGVGGRTVFFNLGKDGIVLCPPTREDKTAP